VLEKHVVKPHAKTATTLAPRTIENGVMRGAGRAALERTPSFSELSASVFCIKSLLDVQKNILRNGFIFVIILIRFFLKSLRLVGCFLYVPHASFIMPYGLREIKLVISKAL